MANVLAIAYMSEDSNNPSAPKCPECNRTLQSKLVDTCLYCGAEVPEHLRLSDEEKAVIKKQQLEQLEKDRELRLQKEAAEKKGKSGKNEVS